MDQTLRDLLWHRSRGYCEVCGVPMQPESWAAHHRKLRKHGGKDAPSNLMAVHHGCHNGSTRSIHLSPTQSYLNGWLVRSWENPERAPVRYHGRRTVLLSDDGTLEELIS